MKVLSVEEFKTLISTHDWKREEDIDVNGSTEHSTHLEIDDRSLTKLDSETYWYGIVTKTSRRDEMEIIFEASFCFEETETNVIDTSADYTEEVWSFTGFHVLDEDGEVLHSDELSMYLPVEFSAIDLSKLN